MAKMVKVDERAYGPGPREDIKTLLAVPGDEIPEDQAKRLGIKAVPPGHRGERDVDGVRSIGGGWFELPNGERVQGEEAARQRLRALRASQAEVTNSPGDFAAGAEGGFAGINRPAGEDLPRAVGTSDASVEAAPADVQSEDDEPPAPRKSGKKS
jgi:hypothetical protein